MIGCEMSEVWRKVRVHTILAKKGAHAFHHADQTLFLGRFSLLIHNYYLLSHIVQALPITSKVSQVFEALKFARVIN